MRRVASAESVCVLNGILPEAVVSEIAALTRRRLSAMTVWAGVAHKNRPSAVRITRRYAMAWKVYMKGPGMRMPGPRSAVRLSYHWPETPYELPVAPPGTNPFGRFPEAAIVSRAMAVRPTMMTNARILIRITKPPDLSIA
jgi:hypothetical protein